MSLPCAKSRCSKKIFRLCSPSRLPSPQFSGNSSAERQQFHVPCVKNYVHWPAMQEWSTWWTEWGRAGQGRAGQRGRTGNRPSSVEIRKQHCQGRREKESNTGRRRSHAVKERRGRSWTLEICSAAHTSICGESREVPGFRRLRHGGGPLLAHI